MIELQDLGKDYGKKTALQNLTLTIKEGEIFGFLGCLLYTSDAADE